MLAINKQLGVTLVELMVGVLVMGILLALAAPSFSSWIQNQQIRAAAESILNGLQVARGQAVQNNAQARFNLCDASSSWQVFAASASAAAASLADGVCGAGVTLTGTTVAGVTVSGTANELRLQDRFTQEGSSSAQVTATSLPAVLAAPAAGFADDGTRSVTFNSYGRLVLNDGAVGAVAPYNLGLVVEVTTPTGTRPLLIVVQSGGSIKMCDPSPTLAATDPRHC